MNSTKAQEEINNLIEATARKSKHARQYPPAKHQIKALEELGILDMMPAGFGYTDAAVVIEAANRSASEIYHHDESETISASALYEALNEEAVDAPETGTYRQIMADVYLTSHAVLPTGDMPEGDRERGRELSAAGYVVITSSSTWDECRERIESALKADGMETIHHETFQQGGLRAKLTPNFTLILAKKS